VSTKTFERIVDIALGIAIGLALAAAVAQWALEPAL
jgi:hypothetical protein